MGDVTEKSGTGVILPHERPPAKGWIAFMSRILAYCVVVLLLIPLLFLGTLELGLRISGYGHSTRFLLKKEFEGKKYFATNMYFYQQFFALPIDEEWRDKEQLIEIPKAKGSYRVVILGESAALGVPPDAAFGFWRMLEVMLRTRFPNTRFEFYPFAEPGISSYALREIARACDVIQPDLFVVYMGNNEIGGPYGVFASKDTAFPMNLPLARMKIQMTNLRLFQMLTGQKRVQWRVPTGIVDNDIPLQDSRILKACDNFRRNLDDICSAGMDAGAAVVLCSVPCNLRDWVPTLSHKRDGLHSPELERWKGFYDEGTKLEEQSEWQGAVTAYEAALAIDDQHAEVHFRLAKCFDGLGNTARAREHYERAWALDFFRARILKPVSDAIREKGKQAGKDAIYFADATSDLAKQSIGETPGYDFFYDNVHLNPAGNYLVAKCVFEQVIKALPQEIRGTSTEISPLTQAECEERLGLSDGVLAKHLERAILGYTIWWKRPCLALKKRLQDLKEALGANVWPGVAAGYGRALGFQSDDRILRTRYAEALREAGDLEAALEQARQLAKDHPHRVGVHRLLCRVLGDMGRTEEAFASLDTALRLSPDDWESHNLRGLLEKKVGRSKEAIDAFKRAILIFPRNRESYEPLDALLKETTDIGYQTSFWAELVKECPDSGQVNFRLATAIEGSGRLQEAIPYYEQACKLEPYDMEFHIPMYNAWNKSGRYENVIIECREHYRDGLADMASIHGPLVDALEKTGDMDGAQKQLIDGIRGGLGDYGNCVRLDMSLVNAGNMEKRASVWRDLTTTFPENPYISYCTAKALEAVQDIAGSREALRKAAAKHVEDPGFTADLALALLAAGDAVLAGDAMKRAMDANPKEYGFLQSSLIEAAEKAGNADGARQLLLDSILRNSTELLYYNKLDKILSDAGDPEGRASVWRDLAAKCPDNSMTQYHLARALGDTGDTAGALDALRKSAAKPVLDDAAFMCGVGQALLQAGDPQLAKDVLQAALKANPQSLTAARGPLLESLKMTGDTEGYRALLTESIVSDPGDLRLCSQLDNSFSASAEAQERLAAWRDITLAHPEHARAHYYYAKALLAIQDTAGALTVLRSAAANQVQDAGFTATLGLALLHAGDPVLAAEVLRRAIATNAQEASFARIPLVEALHKAGDAAGAMSAMEEARAAGVAIPEALVKSVEERAKSK
jgi:tetratricopeptide (TPR) repeat protein